MKKIINQKLLKEIDRANKYHDKYLTSINNIEDHFRKNGMLRDGEDRGIYIEDKYICDMSFFEDASGMTSDQFLELINNN